MDSEKIGRAIYALRKEKGMSQRALADKLHISNKTVSKWECGQGCPDASLWDALAAELGADLLKLLQGDLKPKAPDRGKIDKVQFYICPHCGNIFTSTTKGSISCCGRQLSPLSAEKASSAEAPVVEDLDNDYYVSFDHPMTKDHYLLFVAYVCGDRWLMVRMYPEQACAFHLPVMSKRGQFYFYCTQHGLKKSAFKLP